MKWEITLPEQWGVLVYSSTYNTIQQVKEEIMNNKLSNNLGKIIIGVAVVIITTSAFAKPLICKTTNL